MTAEPASPPQIANGVPINAARLWRLTRKELRETMRDRRTIITLFLMPLLVYPLLSLAFRQFLLSSYSSTEEALRWNIGVKRSGDKNRLEPILTLGERILQQRETQDANSAEREATKPLLSQVLWFEAHDLELGLQSRDLDLGIRILDEQGKDARSDSILKCDILYRADSAVSVDLARAVERRLQAVNDSQWQVRIRELGGNSTPAAEFSLQALSSNQTYSVPLATLVPLILILMTITGAVYPAIDLTAGERERGTLESLVASPIPRFAVLTAKYIAVLTVAVLTALMNIVAMTLTIHSTGLASVLFGSGGLSILAVLQVFGLMVMFAAFFSAVLLALTSFARSFKEAQAYLIPLMLFSMTPGFLAAVPGVSLTGWWAVTPLANMVLLARDVLERGVDPWWAIVAIASTFIYGLSALVLAAHIFGNDAILYGSQEGWEEWFHRPKKVSLQPTMGLAMFTLAIIFPLHVWFTGQLALWAGGSELSPQAKITADYIARSLLGGGVITWGLYFLLPVGIAAVRRLDWKQTFQGLPFPAWSLVGVALLGLSMWPIAHEIVVLSRYLGLATLSDEKLQRVKDVADLLRQQPFWLVFFCIAITPAVCEELFFRGYFFSALKKEAKGWTAILLSGIIFGLFHVILGSGAQVERLFSTSFLGCILAWVAWRTGSVIPSICLHLLHNGLLVSVLFFGKDLSRDPITGTHLPVSWQIFGLVGTTVGIVLVWLSTRRQK